MENEVENPIHDSHEMRIIWSELITVCAKCHLCTCHNLVELSKPCAGPIHPE